MSWFKQHLNWTYILVGLVFPFTLMFVWGLAIGLSSPVVDESAYPSYGLRIYLDDEYSLEWDNNNILDLDNIYWRLGEDGWYDANTTVYLENTGTGVVAVETTVAENPDVFIPGFSVSSTKHILIPDEREPITISFSRSPWYSGTPMVYFQIDPNMTTLDDDSGDVDTASFFVVAVILLIVSGWVLHQKGRSYGWLLFSLSFIGPIVMLCLSNKRSSITVEQSDKEEVGV